VARLAEEKRKDLRVSEDYLEEVLKQKLMTFMSWLML